MILVASFSPGGGIGDDVRGRPLVVGDVFRRVQFEFGLEQFRRRRFFLGFPVRRYFGLDQVLWAPGLWGPDLVGCRCCGLKEGGGVGV